MKIGVINNYDSFVFNLVRYLNEVEGVETIIMKNDQVDYSILDDCDGILLSPGPGIPKDANELMNVIQKYKYTKNLFGVCLGHQALAEDDNIELIQCHSPFHGKASEVSTACNSELFKGLPTSIEVGRYHSWMTATENLHHWHITAKTNEGEVMAIEHKTLKLFGVQFHPESILTPQGRNIINNWINTLK